MRAKWEQFADCPTGRSRERVDRALMLADLFELWYALLGAG